MIRVLITGAEGQLGNEINKASPDFTRMSFHFTDIGELDITDALAVGNFLQQNPFDFIVNCAAYTAVDRAEDEPETAMILNAGAVDILAGECARRNMQLIHISTDYVFDGEKNRPYLEEDPVNPKTVYGHSKLAGERACREAGNGLIIRTSWLYSGYGKNFVKTILELSRKKDRLDVVFDQTGSPTYARDLAAALLEIIGKEYAAKGKPKYDIYHYANTGICSWFEFARSIVELSGSQCTINPIPSRDYPTKAARPRYSVLDKAKLKGKYGVDIPHWKDSLESFIKEEQSIKPS